MLLSICTANKVSTYPRSCSTLAKKTKNPERKFHLTAQSGRIFVKIKKNHIGVIVFCAKQFYFPFSGIIYSSYFKDNLTNSSLLVQVSFMTAYS